MSEPDDERRRDGRTPIDLAVRYERMNAFFADYARNISRGGTFVATEKPLPVGTELVFTLDVPQLAEPLSLRARVVRAVPPEQAGDGSPAGMGIHFQYDDESTREALHRFVEGLMVEQLGASAAEKLLGRSITPRA